MIDRLRSGAGAVADVTDRIVRRFIGLGKAAPAIAAIALAVGAVAALFAGIEASGNPNAQTIAPAAVAGTSDFGVRTYSTISGHVLATYVETYEDSNDNGTQEAEETGQSWFYWMVDRETRAGLTVRSQKGPESVFHYEAAGTIGRDAEYVTDDLKEFSSEIAALGLQFDPAAVIDTADAPTGTPLPYAWTSPPPDGVASTVSGVALGSLVFCSTDSNGDGQCTEDEEDVWDVLVYDPTTKRGVVVFVHESPEFFAATFTGMLRHSTDTVSEAQHPDGETFDFSTLGITVSNDYFLDDGTKPTSAPLAFGAAIVLGLLALVVLVGWRSGYLVFRPASQPLSGGARSMPIGERIPVHVTGTLITPGGPVRVREAAADLVRVALPPEEPPPQVDGPSVAAPPPPNDEPPLPDASVESDAAATPIGPAAGSGLSAAYAETARRVVDEGRSTLIVERRGGTAGLFVGEGELTGLAVGDVVPFRGRRPAIRLTSRSGEHYLSFDSEPARNKAAAELIGEARLTGGLSGVATVQPT